MSRKRLQIRLEKITPSNHSKPYLERYPLIYHDQIRSNSLYSSIILGSSRSVLCPSNYPTQVIESQPLKSVQPTKERSLPLILLPKPVLINSNEWKFAHYMISKCQAWSYNLHWVAAIDLECEMMWTKHSLSNKHNQPNILWLP